MSSHIVPFHGPERRVGIEVSAKSLVQLEAAVFPDGYPHATTTFPVIDRDGIDGMPLVRTFLVCHTCKSNGLDVAIELFTDDGSHMCPAEAAERLYRATLAQLWEDTVGHSRRRGQLEYQKFAALAAIASR
jgi:hypothetical protein